MTEDGGQLAERIERLETRIAHQDRTIEALNEVVTVQWTTIERLKREVEALGERFDDLTTGPGPVDRPPPHY